jgi:hypothetical protein
MRATACPDLVAIASLVALVPLPESVVPRGLPALLKP